MPIFNFFLFYVLLGKEHDYLVVWLWQYPNSGTKSANIEVKTKTIVISQSYETHITAEPITKCQLSIPYAYVEKAARKKTIWPQ